MLNGATVVIPSMFSELVPLLAIFTVCGALIVPCVWFSKYKAEGVKVATAPVVIPVPFNEIVAGVPLIVSVIVPL